MLRISTFFYITKNDPKLFDFFFNKNKHCIFLVIILQYVFLRMFEIILYSSHNS